MNNIYDSAINKLNNNNPINALEEIAKICNKKTFDINLIEFLDNYFSARLPLMQRLFDKNLKLIKNYEYIYDKDFITIDKNPNRCYIVENHLIYLYIAKDYKFLKIDISSKQEVNDILKTVQKDFYICNAFNLGIVQELYAKIQQNYTYGHHILSYNTKKQNYLYLHYDNIDEFSLLMCVYDFAFLKKFNKVVFLMGDDNRRMNKNQVNVLYCAGLNLGDTIGPMIVDWVLKQKNIDMNKETKKDSSLLAVGSLCGMETIDLSIWGSGFHTIDFIVETFKMKHFKKLDIRAVRGPITRYIYTTMGYNVPEVYGDPAILMPFIYEGEKNPQKKYDVSIIVHHTNQEYKKYKNIPNLHFINIKTDNHEFFIDELLASKKIISSALHGIILAETYGIPTVFFNTGDYVEVAMMKYIDWYHSTGRKDFKVAQSLEEALSIEPEPLPDLKELQANLLNAFPYDLWD